MLNIVWGLHHLLNQSIITQNATVQGCCPAGCQHDLKSAAVTTSMQMTAVQQSPAKQSSHNISGKHILTQLNNNNKDKIQEVLCLLCYVIIFLKKCMSVFMFFVNGALAVCPFCIIKYFHPQSPLLPLKTQSSPTKD